MRMNFVKSLKSRLTSDSKVYLWNLGVILLVLLLIPFEGVPIKFAERTYCQALLVGLSMIVVNGVLQNRQEVSLSLTKDLEVVGYFLFVSGLSPYLPFYNPFDFVPLIHFILVHIGVVQSW